MKRKQLIAMLLCLVLLSGFVPVFASANDLTEDSALNPLTSGAFNGSAAQENVIRNLSARLGLNRNTALTGAVSDGQPETAESFRQVAGEGNLSRVSDGVSRAELKQKIKQPQSTAPSTSAAPTITTQPQSTSAAAGTKATFKVEASGSDLSYQWQYRKTASGTWTDSKGTNYNKATFTPEVGSSMDGYQYRCKVSNAEGTVYSNAATLTVTTAAPTITTQPKSATAAAGTKATFKVVASGGGLSYQWQYRKSASGTWVDSKGINYDKATFTPNVGSSMNGYQYRCKVSNAAGTVYSNAVTLTVTTAAPTITTQPKSATAAAGTKATFKVVASGGNLSYQWQYRKSASGTWADSKGINYDKATFTPDVGSSMNGYQYRCKVSNAAGTVYSDAVTLTVTGSAPTSQNPSESGLSKTDFMQGIYKFVIEGKDFYAVNLEEFDRRAAEKRMCAATDKVDFYGSGSLDYAVFTFLYPIEDCMFFLSPVTITLGDKKNNSDVEWSALCRMADEPDSWYRMETFPFADGESAFAEMYFKEPSTILSFTVIPTRFPSGHSPFIISADTASAVVGFADFEAAKRFAESITKMS